MTTEFIRETVAQYFKAGFTTAEIEYENKDTIDVSKRSLPYVKLNLRFTTNDQISFVPVRTRQRGAVQVDIYVKNGTGSKAAYTMADEISELFKHKSISNIEFQTPKVLTPLDVVGWMRLTVRSPFYFDT